MKLHPDAGAAPLGADMQASPEAAPDGAVGSPPSAVNADVARDRDGGPSRLPPSQPGVDPSPPDAAVMATGDVEPPVTIDAATPVTPPAPTRLTDAPAWAAQLPGLYAVQSVAFQEVDSVVTRIQEVRLTQVSQVDDTLQLSSQLCRQVQSNRYGTLTVVAPTSLAPRREVVAFDGDTFSTKPIDVAIGYDSAPPPECAGKVGQRVPKRAFQTWIKGTDCACVEGSKPTPDDCRVLDPDHDEHAGFTHHAAFYTGPADVYAAVDTFNSLVAGVAQSDGRHRGQLQWRERYYQLGCSLSECLDLSTPATGCASAKNPVQFAPLDRLERPALGWTCEFVLARAAEFFPAAAPTTPASCP